MRANSVVERFRTSRETPRVDKVASEFFLPPLKYKFVQFPLIFSNSRAFTVRWREESRTHIYIHANSIKSAKKKEKKKKKFFSFRDNNEITKKEKSRSVVHSSSTLSNRISSVMHKQIRCYRIALNEAPRLLRGYWFLDALCAPVCTYIYI